MNLHLDFSGLFSALVATVLGGIGFIIATVGLIVAAVEKKKNNLAVFQQRAGAFVAGGLFQLGVSTLFFLPLLGSHNSSDRDFRKMMDLIAACSFLFIIGAAVTLIIVLFRKVSAKYYRAS